MPLRLSIAIALSLALHGVLLLPDLLKRLAAAPPPPPLQATLRLPPKPEVPVEPLLKNTLDEEASAKPKEALLPKPATVPPKSTPPPKPVPKNEIQAAQRKLSKHLFYPPEAVARGIEGEVRLILRLSANGAVEEVDIAASSGHRILDNAAIKAAYAMGQLTGAGKRELVLPVVFRLQ